MNASGLALLEACDPVFQVVSRIVADHRRREGTGAAEPTGAAVELADAVAGHSPAPGLSGAARMRHPAGDAASAVASGLIAGPSATTIGAENEGAGTPDAARNDAVGTAARGTVPATGDAEVVRRVVDLQVEVRNAFVRAREIARDRGVEPDFEQVRMPLVYFVDDVLVRAGLPISATWNHRRLAFEHGVSSGDDRFFDDHLVPLIDDASEAGRNRLRVLFTCLALGFRGEPPVDWTLEELRGRCRERLSMDAQPAESLCPAALWCDGGDGDDVTPWPYRILVLLALGLAVALITSAVLWNGHTRDLAQELHRIAGAASSVALEEPLDDR